MEIIGLVVIGLLVVLFLVAAFFCLRTWHWLDVVMLVLLFFGSFYMLYALAGIRHNRVTWGKRAAELTAQIAKVKRDTTLIEFGDPLEAVPKEWPDPAAPLITMRATLARTVADRNRVWKNCTATRIDLAANQIEVTTTETPNAIKPDDLLYAFAEMPDTKIPLEYLGEFRVTAATENTVTMGRTTVLNFADLQQASGTTWTLYAVMPIDSHYAFSVSRPTPNYQLPIFGEPISEDDLRTKWLTNRFNLPQTRYDEIIQQYRRDGGKWNAGEPEENHWVKVRFKKSYETAEPVDSPDVQGARNRFYFDAAGRADVAALRIGVPEKPEKVKFAEGDFAVFDAESAAKLVSSGVCDKEDDVYVRELNDYGSQFHTLYERMVEVEEAIASLKIRQTAIDKDIATAQNQIRIRTDEQGKLQGDQTKFDAELAAANQYATELTTSWNEVRRRLSASYKNTDASERLLQKISERLSRPGAAQPDVAASR